MGRRNTMQKCIAALAVMVLSGSLQAQEMFNVNVWNIGRPASRGGIWGDGVDDDAELATLMRMISAPYFLMTSSGCMELPRDFDIFRPSPSTTKPLVTT